MKRLFMTTAIMAVAATVSAQTAITLETAGTLKDKINATEKYEITELKISGPINGDDVIVIRDMAGIDLDNNATEGKLETLDLADTQVVEGGEPYYTDFNAMKDYGTTDNEVSDMMFFKCKTLKSVTVPNSATAIGEAAFKDCKTIAEVKLSAGITEIRKEAFSGTAITEFAFPAGVMPAEGVFKNCASLTKVTLPDGITAIGKSAFSGCDKATKIKLPENLTKISDATFSYCEAVEELEIGEGVTEIGKQALMMMSSLKKLTLPASLTLIDQMAVALNNTLEEIHCKGAKPSQCGMGVFRTSAGDVPENCTLYVPEGSKAEYETAETWSLFTKISEEETTAIDGITGTEDRKEMMRYDAAGRKISSPHTGINIIVYSDGTTGKVIVRE